MKPTMTLMNKIGTCWEEEDISYVREKKTRKKGILQQFLYNTSKRKLRNYILKYTLSSHKDNGDITIRLRKISLYMEWYFYLLLISSFPMTIDVSMILIDTCKVQKCFTKMVDFSVWILYKESKGKRHVYAPWP